MNANQCHPELSKWDQLISRPAQPLPTCQDPKAPRGYPADPKPRPAQGQGTDPDVNDIGRTA